jgi:hemerythrin
MNNHKNLEIAYLLMDGDELVSTIKKSVSKIRDAIVEDTILRFANETVLLKKGTFLDGFATKKEIKKEIIKTVKQYIKIIKDKYNVDEVRYSLYFTTRENFRKLICSDYKRKDDVMYQNVLTQLIREILIEIFKEYNKHFKKKGKVFIKLGFEADDLMGMYATFIQSQYPDSKVFIQSQDKDMKVIPNITIYNPKMENEDERFLYISNRDSVMNFLAQVLAGDIADNVIHTPKKIDFNGAIMKNGYSDKKNGAIQELWKMVNNNDKTFNDLYNFIRNLYIANDMQERFLINCKLLRILTLEFYNKEDDTPLNFDEGYLYNYLENKFYN